MQYCSHNNYGDYKLTSVWICYNESVEPGEGSFFELCRIVDSEEKAMYWLSAIRRAMLDYSQIREFPNVFEDSPEAVAAEGIIRSLNGSSHLNRDEYRIAKWDVL